MYVEPYSEAELVELNKSSIVSAWIDVLRSVQASLLHSGPQVHTFASEQTTVMLFRSLISFPVLAAEQVNLELLLWGRGRMVAVALAPHVLRYYNATVTELSTSETLRNGMRPMSRDAYARYFLEELLDREAAINDRSGGKK